MQAIPQAAPEPQREAPQPPGQALARVLAARDLTPTLRALRVQRPEGFVFQASQPAMLGVPVDGGWDHRPLSIASGPARPYLEFAVRRSPSTFKQALLRLRPGDAVRVQGPGQRFPLDEARPAVFLAGGVGITPFVSMLEHAVDRRLPGPFALVHSHRSPDEVPYQAELEALAAAHGAITLLPTVTRPGGRPWQGRVGRIDAPLVASLAAAHPGAVFYLAGAPAMVVDLVQHLLAVGVPEERIRFEAFHGY